jgi:hypothetical protein
MMPDFFVVGAARASTTSLNRYLSQHPDIYIPPAKEMHFFAAEYFPCSGPGDDWMNKLVVRDEAQYAQFFDKVAGEKAVGETSAFYLCLPGTAERIAQAVPNARIIMILREPVARTYSAYMHLVREGRETLSFEEGLQREAERKQQGYEPMWWYKELSLYAAQVQRYLEVFGPERVKVLLYEEFYAHPEQGLREIFAFLGVKQDVPIDASLRYNPAGEVKSRRLYTALINFIRYPNPLQKSLKSMLPLQLRRVLATKAVGMLVRPVPMDTQIDAQLKPYFKKDVAKLEEVLQRDLRCWGYQEPKVALNQSGAKKE